MICPCFLLLLGALVPCSPVTQAECLSFHCSKWAWKKIKGKTFFSTLFWKSSLDWELVTGSPVTYETYLIFRWWKWARGKNLRKNLGSWTTFVFFSILKSQILIDLVTAIRSSFYWYLKHKWSHQASQIFTCRTCPKGMKMTIPTIWFQNSSFPSFQPTNLGNSCPSPTTRSFSAPTGTNLKTYFNGRSYFHKVKSNFLWCY